ncbi:MAG: protein kinase [Ktedonobacteraceae bacterium]|nr:protein kinase [Ktedonobacteraceae bacterium]
MSTDPRRLNRYELQTRLGRGGMAEVWKAFDPQLQRYVAIKILHADLQNDPSFISRFEHEAQLIASLHHHNIVQIYDFHASRSPETDETVAYMVMDYVEGITLSQYLRSTSRKGLFPSPADIVSIFIPICQAVDYAHKKGMLHRDLKPANILLDKRNVQHKIGEPILSDFGIAKLLGCTDTFHSGWWIGTPHYTSPEQARGELGDERSDIYALAVILYEMCVGTLPFQGDHPTTIMMHHINADPIPPRLVNPSIQPALAAAILCGLAKAPADRFPNASAIGIAVAESLHVSVPPDLLPSTYQAASLNNSIFTDALPAEMTPGSSSRLGIPSLSSPQTGISTLTPISSSNWPPLHAPIADSNISDANRISIPYSPLSIGPTDSEPNTDSSDRESVVQVDSSRSVSKPLSPDETRNISRNPASFRSAKVKWAAKRQALLTILIVFLLLTGSLSTLFLLAHHSLIMATSAGTGNVFFINSGLLNTDNSQGINDEVLLDLHNVPGPAAGKAYYGWLLSDKGQSEPATTALGRLPVDAGNIHFLYKGAAEHNNLLLIRSRLLITQEDAGIQPASYSPDYSNWAYYGQLSQAQDPQDKLHFSMLAHLRHLLAESPELQIRGLHGGLDMWFLRNTEKVLELANSAQDNWRVNFTQLRAQIISILDYLDGKDSVRQDIPMRLSVMVTNPHYVQVPLVGPFPDGQDPAGYSFADESPPGYVYLISSHLAGTVLSLDATPEQRDLAGSIQVAIDQVKNWLEQVRLDAKHLIAMNGNQLSQPSTFSLIDDMILNAQYAFSGQTDPITGQNQGGAIWICNNIQRMASFTIKPFDQKTYKG